MERVLLSLAAAILIPLSASADTTWKGKSTNLAGTFNYGAVSFKVSGNKIRNFIIEGVTTSGCGGYKSVIVPSIKITGNKFSALYTPISGINDKIRVNGSFSGTKATGTFSEGPLCSNAGKFKVTRK